MKSEIQINGVSYVLPEMAARAFDCSVSRVQDLMRSRTVASREIAGKSYVDTASLRHALSSEDTASHEPEYAPLPERFAPVPIPPRVVAPPASPSLPPVESEATVAPVSDHRAEEFITLAQAAVEAGLSADYVRRLGRSGSIGYKRVGKQSLIERNSLQAFMSERTRKDEEKREMLRAERERVYARSGSHASDARRIARTSDSSRTVLLGTSTLVGALMIVGGALTIAAPHEMRAILAAALGGLQSRLDPTLSAPADSQRAAPAGVIASAASKVASATSTENQIVYQTIVQNPVVERIIEVSVPQPLFPPPAETGVITAAYVNDQIKQFENSFSTRLTSLSAASAANSSAIAGNYVVTAQTNRIDKLGDVDVASSRITDSTITSTTISGGSITGTSISGGALTPDSVSTGSLTATATSTLATTTFSGYIDVQGNATSTFAKGISLSGGCFSLNGTCMGVTAASSTILSDSNTFSGNNTLSGTTTFSGNVTLASATSTSFFATTASSTNLFASIAQLGSLTVLGNTTHTGTLTQTGLATFTNGFVSQASSTVAGAFTSTGNVAFGGTLTVSGQCVTADTRLRRRRKKAMGMYEYDEPEIIDIEPGDEILSLDERTGALVWSRVRGVAFMGVKQTYRITTADGRTIRTTANHPYLVRDARGKMLRHRSPIAEAGWASVANLREGDEIAVAGMVLKGVSSGVGRAALVSDKRPVSHAGPAVETAAFSMIARTEKAALADGSPFMPCKMQANPDAFSIDMDGEMSMRVVNSPTEGFAPSRHCLSGLALHSAAGLRGFYHEVQVESVLAWAKIASIEAVAEEDVYDVEIEGTHNFVGNGIVAHNTAIFNQASTTQLTNTGATWLTNLTASTLLALDANKQIISTTTIGTNLLTGSLGTINSTTFNRGDTITITAASSTLLANNNSFAGANTFTGSNTFSGNTTLASATSTNFAITNITHGLLSTNGSGSVVATTSIGTNLLTANTISGITLGGTLGALTATDSSLTFSGSYTGATARTVGLNLGNSNWWTARQNFTTASTSQFTATSSVWFTNLASALLATDANGLLISTTTIGTNLLTGSLGTINSTTFNRGDSITITAASSTLLANNNTFSGNNMFLASTTIGDGSTTGGLTINGGATTTGTAYFAGNVGIGSTTPGNKLVVSDAAGVTLFLDRPGNRYLTLSTTGTLNASVDFTMQAGGVKGFYINNSGRATVGSVASQNVNVLGVQGNTAIGSNFYLSAAPTNGLIVEGSVGIGTTSPWKMLSVAGDIIGTNLTATGTLAVSGATTLANASTTQLTNTGATWLTNLTASTLLALDANKQIISTTTIGTNLLTGSLGTINSTTFNRGDSITITAASSTLLANNNTFSGNNMFLASTTIGAGGQTTGLTISGGATTTGNAYFAGNVGVGQNTFGVNGALQVTGGIGMTGNSSIRQSTNSDGNTLTFLGTQLVIGSSNGVSYDYSGGGLIASRSNADSALLFDAGRVSGSGAFKIANTTNSELSINLTSSVGASTLFASTNTGFVGIGTTSPATTLSVAGSGYLTAGLGVGVLNTTSGTIQSSGNITAGGVLAINGTTGTTTVASGQGFTIGSSQFVLQQGSGNVGIGTANPFSRLTVQGSSAAGIVDTTSGDTTLVDADLVGQFGFRSIDTDAHVGGDQLLGYVAGVIEDDASGGAFAGSTNEGMGISFFTSGLRPSSNVAWTPAERMRITKAGNVGIGTTSPYKMLSVAGDIIGTNLTATGTLAVTGATTLSSTLGVTGLSTLTGGARADGGFGQGIAPDTGNNAFLAYSTTANSLWGYTAYNQNTGGTGARAGYAMNNSNYNAFLALNGSGYSSSGLNNADAVTLQNGGPGGMDFALTNASGNMRFWTNSLQRLAITSAGNVGIGTTSPATTLSVAGSGYLTAGLGVGVLNTTSGTIQSSGNMTAGGVLAINGTTGTTTIASGQGFTIGSSQFVLQQGSGYVGIGTTSPENLLTIEGNNANATLAISAAGTTQGTRLRFLNSSTVTNWQIGTQQNVGNAFEITPSTAVGGRTFSTPAVVVLSTGNIGIGTTTPDQKLDVYGSGSPRIKISAPNASSPGLLMQQYGQTAWTLYNPASSNDLRLYDGADRVTFQTGGNVGIGTANPNGRLSLGTGVGAKFLAYDNNSNIFSGIGIDMGESNAVTLFAHGQAGSGFINFGIAGNSPSTIESGFSEKMRITNGGNVGIGTTSPATTLSVAGSGYLTAGLGVGVLNTTSGTIQSSGNMTAGGVLAINGTTGTTTIASGQGFTIGSSQFVLQQGSGNVSVGTASATSRRLNVQASAGSDILTVDYGTSLGGNGGIEIYNRYANTTDIAGIKLVSAGATTGQVVFATNNAGGGLTERMRITESGNVGIGTTDPGGKLHAYNATAISSVGNTATTTREQWTTGNAIYLDTFARRHTAGSDWTGTNLRMQKMVDVTKMGFIDFGIDSLASDQGIGFGSGSDTRMVLTSAGNVGIGTTSPSSMLTVGTDGTAQAVTVAGNQTSIYTGRPTVDNAQLKLGAFNTTQGGGIEFQVSSASSGYGWKIAAPNFSSGGTNDSLLFLNRQNSATWSEAMRIQANGNIGIGTTTPGAKLDVQGGSGDNATFALTNNSGNAWKFWNDNGASGLNLQYNASTKTTLSNAGNFGIAQTSPGSLLHVGGGTETLTITPTAQIAASSGSSTLAIAAPNAVGASAQLWLENIGQRNWTISSDRVLDALTFGVGADATRLMTILSGGNVGIGNTAPAAKLDVSGSIATNRNALYLAAGGDANHVIDNGFETLNGLSDGETFVGQDFINLKSNVYGSSMLFLRGSNGHVGVSSTTPWAKLAVSATDNASVPQFVVASSSATSLIVNSAGKVGVGTTTPMANLAIKTGSTFALALAIADTNDQAHIGIWDDGRIGIGSTTATTELDIRKSGGGKILFTSGSDFSHTASGIKGAISGANAGLGFYVTNNTLGNGDPSSEKMRLSYDGNLGIGTTTPFSKLTVSTGDIGAFNGAICADNGGTTKCYGTLTAGVVYGDSSSFAASDVAEKYTSADTTLVAGEVVALDHSQNTSVKRAAPGDHVFGVISTAPGVLLGDETGTSSVPVALSGRVPVRVNLEGGEIAVGDRLTLSSQPGVAMKATSTVRTVGFALEPYTASATSSTVLVFIEPELTLSGDDVAALRGQELPASAIVERGPFTAMAQAIAQRISGLGSMIVRVFDSAIAAAVGIFDKLFVDEIYAGLLCLAKSDGTEVCVTGDQLDALLAGAAASTPSTPSSSPPSTPSESDTSPADTGTDPSINSTESTTEPAVELEPEQAAPPADEPAPEPQPDPTPEPETPSTPPTP